MEPCDPADQTPLNSMENPVAARGGLGELAWAVVKMRAGEGLTIDEGLIAAFQAASSPHTIRALESDLEAFDLWCRRTNRITLPAAPEVVADYLHARGGESSKPASLSRYKASIARVHQLLGIADPTAAPLVRLWLAAINKAKGVAQTQARPLRFKGPVRDVAGDTPRGLNIRALLDNCPGAPTCSQEKERPGQRLSTGSSTWRPLTRRACTSSTRRWTIIGRSSPRHCLALAPLPRLRPVPEFRRWPGQSLTGRHHVERSCHHAFCSSAPTPHSSFEIFI